MLAPLVLFWRNGKSFAFGAAICVCFRLGRDEKQQESRGKVGVRVAFQGARVGIWPARVVVVLVVTEYRLRLL